MIYLSQRFRRSKPGLQLAIANIYQVTTDLRRENADGYIVIHTGDRHPIGPRLEDEPWTYEQAKSIADDLNRTLRLGTLPTYRTGSACLLLSLQSDPSLSSLSHNQGIVALGMFIAIAALLAFLPDKDDEK